MKGLYLRENVISEDMEREIVEWLDKREWSRVLPRRTQHFGYQYEYSGTNLVPGDPFEGWISYIANWLKENKIMDEVDQCII